MPITGRTTIVFLLADPVDHVVGSVAITKGFQEHNIDAAVVPLQVRPERLRQVLETIRILPNVAGAAITVPHKVKIMPLLDKLTDRAERAGAVNWVRRNHDGSLEGENLDGAGFVAGLQSKDIRLAGARVLLLGAGGVARAIAASLAEAGVAVIHVANRTSANAESLVDDLRPEFPQCAIDLGTADATGYDIVINATTIGLSGNGGFPVPESTLSSHSVVADVIMKPAVTPLLAVATARGCVTVPGLAMLEPQQVLMEKFMRLEGREK